MIAWDPRWRLATILLAAALVVGLNAVSTAALALALSTLVAIVAGVSIVNLLARWGLLAVSLVPFILALPFLDQSTLAAIIALKALAIGTLALVLVQDPLPRTLAAAHALGLPSTLSVVAALTLRYTAVLKHEFWRLRVAARVRGFRGGVNFRTYHTLAHGIGALIVRADDRAERVSAAMQARGFDGSYRTLSPFRTRTADVVLSIIVITPFALLLGFGFSSPPF